MQFVCDRCGKRYSTNQEIREGRAYRFKCRVCGHEVIVRGPVAPQGGGSGNGVPEPRPEVAVEAPAPPPLPRPPITSVVIQPSDVAPPEGGYVEFKLDDDVVTSQLGIPAERVETPADGNPLYAPPPDLSALPPAEDPPAEGSPPEGPPPEGPPPEGPPAEGPPAEAAAPSEDLFPPPRFGQVVRRPLSPAARRKAIIALVVGLSAVAGVVLASTIRVAPRGGGAAQEVAPPPDAPGVLRARVYVGPVSFEEPVPELEPSSPQPRPRPPPRREALARRAASREAPPPAPIPASAAAEPRAPEPPPLPTPEPPRGAPAVAAAAPAAVAPAAVAPAPPPQAPTPAPEPPAGSDEPIFARDGYRRPVATVPGCIEGGIRLTPDLADRLPGGVTMRFAVARDGSPGLVQVLPGPEMAQGERVDPRLAEALRRAVLRCTFTPGADEAGRSVRLWVVMHVRFQ